MASVLFLLVGLATLAFAAMSFKEKGEVDWRVISGSAAAIGFTVWSISAMKHPEEWLDSDGHARRSFRFWK